MENETVLIVDDDNDAVEMLELFLSSMNYQTLAASNGKSGLKIGLEHHPDLIFLDLNILSMGGLEMLKELHQKECTLPVIFMTANDSEKIKVDAFRLGVREYLNKPFTGDEVSQVMDHALRETRLAREREILNHNLRTAEVVRVTAVTLSHYLNNYLTALNGGLQLLEEILRQDFPNPELLQLVGNSRDSSANIEAVMRVLLSTADMKMTSYSKTTSMLDIEAALNNELEQMTQFRRNMIQDHQCQD